MFTVSRIQSASDFSEQNAARNHAIPRILHDAINGHKFATASSSSYLFSRRLFGDSELILRKFRVIYARLENKFYTHDFPIVEISFLLSDQNRT